MAEGVPVRFEDQLILKFKQLNGSAQVARFKPGFEYECGVRGILRQVIWEDVNTVVLRVEITSLRSWFLDVVHNFVQQGVQEAYALDFPFD
jgi:hypothetical protein